MSIIDFIISQGGKSMRRFIAFFLAIVMCFSFIGECAFAENVDDALPPVTENVEPPAIQQLLLQEPPDVTAEGTTDPAPTTDLTQTTDPTPTADPTQTTDPAPTTDPTQTTDPTPTADPTQTTDPTPTVEPATTPEPTPTTEPTLEPAEVGGVLSVAVSCNKTEIEGRFTAGVPETAELTAVVTRHDETIPFPESLKWESSLPCLSVADGGIAGEDGNVRTFKAIASYTYVPHPNAGTATITASAAGGDSGIISGSTAINVLPAQFTAKITDGTENAEKPGFEFALLNKENNTYTFGDALSFGFTAHERNKDKDDYISFSWEASMRNTEDTGDIPIHVKANEDNTEFTLYLDSACTTPVSATGDVVITLTGKTTEIYRVFVTGDDKLYKTVFLSSDVAETDKNYLFYVAHPEDLEAKDEKFESSQAYSLPLVKIDNKDYSGYALKKVNPETPQEFEGKKYKQYWEISIPKERLCGDIVIDANRCDIKDSRFSVNLEALSKYGAQFVPFAENEKFVGNTIAVADDSEDPDTEEQSGGVQNSEDPDEPKDNKKQEYYFYFRKNQEKPYDPHPVYSIDGVSHPLSPLPVIDSPDESEDSSIYKISDIDGDVTVTMGYNVSKQGSGTGKDEELHIYLPSETAAAGEDYKFKVRTYDYTESQFAIRIYMGSHGLVYPAAESEIEVKKDITYEVKSDELGQYVEFLIPASEIDGDIIIEGACFEKINYRLKFVDNYNIEAYGLLAYKSFDFTCKQFISGTYSAVNHIGQIENGISNFSFEILAKPLYVSKSGPVPDGTTSDPNIYRYTYDFTGSTMGGETVSVDGPFMNGANISYIVNGGQPLTDDVIIKAKLVPVQYSIKVIGQANVSNRETYASLENKGYVTRYTGRRSDYPTYRYLFEANVNSANIRKVYLRLVDQTNGSVKTYPYNIEEGTGTAKAQIYGDYIAGPVIVKALGKDELDVYVTGDNANDVSFPYNASDCDFYKGCVAQMGTNLVLNVSLKTRISSVKVGNMTLQEGEHYKYSVVSNSLKQYVIPGKYMNADATVYAEAVPAQYEIEYKGEYKNAIPATQYAPVQYDTVESGKDYVFLVSQGIVGITVSGKSRNRALKKDVDYYESDGVYTILAGAITGKIVITISPYTPQRTKDYTNESTKLTDRGTELDIETDRYLTLDNGKTMYFIIARGEPDEDSFVCFNSGKMYWVEAYGGYVWMEVSEDNLADFSEQVLDSIDTLSDVEILTKLVEEKESEEEKVSVPLLEEVVKITEEDKVNCDVNEDGKVDEEDLRLMRRMFDCDFEDFDDISMRSFIIADADFSGELNMCDAAVIKSNFDSNNSENEESEYEEFEYDEAEDESTEEE